MNLIIQNNISCINKFKITMAFPIKFHDYGKQHEDHHAFVLIDIYFLIYDIVDNYFPVVAHSFQLLLIIMIGKTNVIMIFWFC